jgi:hypothetical protein
VLFTRYPSHTHHPLDDSFYDPWQHNRKANSLPHDPTILLIQPYSHIPLTFASTPLTASGPLLGAWLGVRKSSITSSLRLSIHSRSMAVLKEEWSARPACNELLSSLVWPYITIPSSIRYLQRSKEQLMNSVPCPHGYPRPKPSDSTLESCTRYS